MTAQSKRQIQLTVASKKLCVLQIRVRELITEGKQVMKYFISTSFVIYVC